MNVQTTWEKMHLKLHSDAGLQRKTGDSLPPEEAGHLTQVVG